jgi:hypothetical protein
MLWPPLLEVAIFGRNILMSVYFYAFLCVLIFLTSYPFWMALLQLIPLIHNWSEQRRLIRHYSKKLDEAYPKEEEEESPSEEVDIEFPQQYAIAYAEQFKLLDTGQVQAVRATAHLPVHGCRLQAISRALDN